MDCDQSVITDGGNGFVFQFFVPVHVDNYFLFLFAGLLPWNFLLKV
jgi:ABC-type polysaccharide/polyol phosphate export permease